MNEAEDYYAVLGVTATSDDVVIKGAYKALMLKYHPDTNKSADATRRAAAINSAYAVLGDPVRRAAYDRQRTTRAAQARAEKEAERTASSAPPPPPPPPRAKPQAAAPAVEPEAAPASKGSKLLSGAFLCLCVLGGISVIDNTSKTPVASAESAPAAVVSEADPGDNMTLEALPTDEGGNVYDGTAGEEVATEVPSDPMDKTTPTPSLDYTVIESAATDATKAIGRGGLAAARVESQSCHDGIAALPTWSGADRCAAIDYAVRLIDQQVSKAQSTPENAYFKFREDNLVDLYQASSLGSYYAAERLERIRKAVTAATYQIVAEDMARRGSSDDPAPRDALAEGAGTGPQNEM